MTLHPFDVAPFLPTDDAQDDGSWEPLDWPDAPLPTTFHPYGPRTTPLWCWAAMGAALGLGFLWSIGVFW